MLVTTDLRVSPQPMISISSPSLTAPLLDQPVATA